MMMSGSWRRKDRRAAAKLRPISSFICTWLMPARLNSTGSSAVMMLTSSLFSSDSAEYRVVVLGTFGLLRRLCDKERRLKVVRLKRNFGQTAALAAGLAHAHGDVVVLMDGDGQNDPADIPTLLRAIEQGNDLVAGWRYKRRDPFFRRRLPSMIANLLISWTTKVKLHDY